MHILVLFDLFGIRPHADKQVVDVVEVEGVITEQPTETPPPTLTMAGKVVGVTVGDHAIQVRALRAGGD